MATAGLNSRAVEVIYEGLDEKGPFWVVGSGSFVCPNLVLTASHCIPPGPGKLRVRLLYDGREYPAVVRLQADKDKVDLAVLEVSDVTVEVPALRYGEVDRNVSGTVKECRAIGFPWFKRMNDKPGAPRFSAQVDGVIPTGENYGQPILTLQITNKDPRPLPDDKSEWAGISGAVVFSSNDIIIGVLTEHHLPEGERALAVVPITAIDDLLPSAEAVKWWQLLGVDRRVRLPDEESSLLSHLEQYKLQTLLADKTRGFVGRQHVFEKIEKFLRDQDRGYLLIEGDPGIGKSSILAEYVRRTGCIAHFNVRSQGIVKASQFLDNVCSQLIVNYRLPYPSLSAKATQDGVVLGKLLQEASERLQPGERLVIAVDALDETDPNAQAGCSNCLCLPQTLPNGAYFIMTKRPRTRNVQLMAQAPQELLDLMLFPAENRSDVEEYIGRRAEQPKVRSWIEQQKIPTVEAFVKKLAELSQDNFMYLYYVLPEIEKGTYQNLSIEMLPNGLEGYYKDHWKRMGMSIGELKIIIIYILSESPKPISFTILYEILMQNNYKVTPIKVQSVLSEWGQFLDEQLAPEGKRYSIYHNSFRDFLNRQDIVKAAGVTIKGINKLIDEYLSAGLS